MTRSKALFLSCFLLFTSSLRGDVQEKPYVIADIYGQMGNNLFQVATASALAWDNGAQAYFPGLNLVPTLYQHIFSRCKVTPPDRPLSFQWQELGFPYTAIPFRKDMKINGYFQSEKYFKHHREKLLELFAPTSRDLKHIQKKYSSILNHPNTVGVQIRYYFEDQNGEIFIQYGKDYLEKAMALFDNSALFVVSSNNMEFAKKNVPTQGRNVLFLENDPFYIDFYVLSMCKHNIITNSTFGWWSAWLNQNPGKKIVRPKVWINGYPTQDVCPESWIQVDGKKGCVRDPSSY